MKKSRVGKIAVYGEKADVFLGQYVLQSYLSTHYHLTKRQQSHSHFHWPCAWWSIPTPLWSVYSFHLSHRHPHVHASIAHSMRPAKDASVDMLLPLSYSYFLYSSIVQRKSPSRCHAWSMDQLKSSIQECFAVLDSSCVS